MAPKKNRSAFEEELILATEHVQKRDKKLGKIIDQVGPCLLKIEEMHSPFASLAEAIIYQQLTGKAAGTIAQRVKNLFLEKATTPLVDAVSYPEPHRFLEVSDEVLRSAGLSRAKTAAIKDLSMKTMEGHVPSLDEMQKLSDDELIKRLSAIRGIGQWTVEMLLIFRLGRLNILPSTDYGVRKGFAYTYKTGDLPTPKALLEYGEKWQPYRTIAAWYLWRAAGMAKL